MKKITKWESIARGVWKSGTDGYGMLHIQRASQGVYYVLTVPYTGHPTVIQQWKTLALAKMGGEHFAQRLHVMQGKNVPQHKGTNHNPRRRTVTRKKTRSAAQIRATRKMIAAARTRRGTRKKTARRRNPVGNTIRGTYQNALPPRNPPQGRRLNPINDYGIKGSGKWFDGAGWTPTKRNACKWNNLKTCQRVAQKLSDHTNKAVTIHSM